METKTRFDLNAAVQTWQQGLAAQPELTPEVRRELETHLCDTVVEFQKHGLNDEEAFLQAHQRIGQPKQLGEEYMKANPPQWNRPVAFAAWALFVVSFFLPSYADGYGYACAVIPVYYWSEALRGNSGAIHIELLTLANVLMLVSPWLLFRFCGTVSRMKWMRWLTFVALILVWSFVIRLLVDGGGKELKFGCYVWSFSFALLFYATLSKSAAARRILKPA